MKNIIVLFVCAVVCASVNSAERCEKCIPKEKCDMYGDMSKREQDEWVKKHPCRVLTEEDDNGPLFGFAPMAKGDLVCCPYSNIWGVENPTTSASTDNLGSRFGQPNDDRKYRPNSREYHSDDGYNQDNLHKKQNSNINRNENEGEDDSNYEKQRIPFRPRKPTNSIYGRGPTMNNNGPRNQPIIQGGGNNRLPVFGANGMPITSGSNFNDNNFNKPKRPVNSIAESPSSSNGRCSVSVLPPDTESGCCGLDLAGERMYGITPNYKNRPARPNANRPTNSNFGPPTSNFGPSRSDFGSSGSNFRTSYPDFGSHDSWDSYPRRRYTRETPEELGISLDNRIAGGKQTDLYQFPWTVLLKTTFDYGDRKATFNCGGSLISSRYVLTAAHCVTEPKGKISNIDVYLAEYDKRTFPRDCINTPEGRQCIDNILVHAEGVQVHPYYDEDKLQSDIALIRLQENIPYTEYTRPICLPPINIDNPEYSNLRLAVAGWGRNGSVPSDLKQSTVVNLVPQRQCSASYPRLTKQHLCAAGHTGEDTCKGDSGGPLMMLYQGKYYVSGVVSGKRADAPCGTSVPSLYTNVYQYLPWIQQTLRN